MILKRKKWAFTIILCLSLAGLIPMAAKAQFDPTCPDGTPYDPEVGCDCPDGSHVGDPDSCPVPLDTYVLILVGIAGIYGTRKLRGSSASA